ncbi:MAG: hypothetical protein QOH72_3776 [Solirubrobacteraceae bacterium]|nr:hypothetical protein [Solirubrobacteraceae bacterium]
MTIDLYAIGTRFTKIAAVAALVLAATLLVTPTAAHAASRTSTNVLAQGTGMTGSPSVRVRIVQRALRQRGYDLGATGVDGRFGPRTAAAVRRFQARRGLSVDGIVGRSTRASLRLARGVTRGAKKPARHSQRRARRHRHTQTNGPATTRPATPSTAVPAAPPATSTPTPNTPPTTSTVQAPAAGPAATPTTAATDHNGTGWGVPLAIGAIAVFLIIASAPMFFDSAPRRRHRARRAGKAAETARRTASPDPTAASRAANGVETPVLAGSGSNGRQNNGRQVRPRPAGASAAGEKHSASPTVNGNGTAPLATGKTDKKKHPASPTVNGNGTAPLATGKTDKKHPASPTVNGNGTAPLAAGDAVFGYVRVTDDQRAASIRAIRDTCGREGWSLVAVVCDRANGNPRNHPDLTEVLERIAAGELGGLVIGHDAHGNGSAADGDALDVGSLAGPDFALHHLGVDAEACDVALITLDGRRSPKGRAVS